MQTEIIEMVLALPDKQCLSDPLPTWLLKKSVNVLAPFLCWLFCRSLEHGVVPSSMKSAYITPILKKADLDSSDPKSYRPISNLSVLSKLLERLVGKQLVAYLLENDLFPDLQSAYRSNHSTETAVLKVLSDILLALDSGKLALLSLLHLSAAFDSANTLLQRLQTFYGLGGNVIAWLASCLTERTQYACTCPRTCLPAAAVRTAASRSISLAVLFGVSQGSVLGPVLFLLYVADLLQLVKRHGLHPHCYADDTQIYGFCDPSDVDALQERLSVCIDEVFS